MAGSTTCRQIKRASRGRKKGRETSGTAQKIGVTRRHAKAARGTRADGRAARGPPAGRGPRPAACPGGPSRCAAGMFGVAAPDNAAAAKRTAGRRPPDRGSRPRSGAGSRPAASIRRAAAPATRGPTASWGGPPEPRGRRSGTTRACRNLPRLTTNKGFAARRARPIRGLRPGRSPPGRPRGRSGRTTLAGWGRARASGRRDFHAARICPGARPAGEPRAARLSARIPRAAIARAPGHLDLPGRPRRPAPLPAPAACSICPSIGKPAIRLAAGTAWKNRRRPPELMRPNFRATRRPK